MNCDGALIERVLQNLLENAGKYAGSAARIAIGARVGADGLEVEISDSGPGIPADQLPHIFNKFTRGDKESAIPGVGLGLAICRAIIDIHGGRIWVESPPQGGAHFHFTLPLETVPEIDPETDEEMTDNP